MTEQTPETIEAAVKEQSVSPSQEKTDDAAQLSPVLPPEKKKTTNFFQAHIQTDKNTLPHSTEAEQALLGVLMYNNNLFDIIDGTLRPDHFYTPLHARIFEATETLIAKGWEASPITIHETLRDRAKLAETGDIMQALAAMLERATTTTDIKALTQIIFQSYLQRKLIEIGDSLKLDASAAEGLGETTDIINRTESDLFQLAEDGTGKKREIQNLTNPLKNVLARAEAAKTRKSPLIGITTGFASLNGLLGGFQDSDLIILAARPSMGKTAFVTNLAQNIANALLNEQDGGAAVGIFSLEMSAEQLAARMLSVSTGVDANKLQQGTLTDDDFERIISQANALNDMQIYIDDTPQLHINMLRSRARRMVRQYNVGAIVVDYLQLMRGEGGRGDFNRVQEITSISIGLKSLARELNVPVIALSQLSRAVESRDNKRPQLSDLRESGSIEQDADIVMFLYREDYYLEKQVGNDTDDPKLQEMREKLERVRGRTELLISKNRKGPTGTVGLIFNPSTTSFEDETDQMDRERFHG